MFDLIIKNATIINGKATPAFKGDVGIKGSSIAAVEQKISHDRSEKFINAKGHILSPGFIDVHGHSDVSILAAPEATGKISQGITTEIVGNCGLSVFPVTDNNRDHLQALYNHYNIKINWNSVSDFAQKMSRRLPAINLASLCGHNTLRAAVLGYNDVKIDQKLLEKMRRLLRSSLEQGASGFSTGFFYVPGIFAGGDEIKYLLKEVGTFAKPYVTHLRNEGRNLLEAIDEAIASSFAAGCRHLHISHLKTAGKENWHKLDNVFMQISEAQKRGLHITADRYPYTESMTQLGAFMPSPYDHMDSVSLKKCLKTPEKFTKLLKKLEEFPEERWGTLRLINTSAEIAAFSLGKTFAEIGKNLRISPSELCAVILRDDAAGAIAGSQGMSEENMCRIIKQPYICCGTDESARPEDYSIGRGHPRGFGSLPCFINLLKSEIGIEETIRKVTSLPAEIFRLKNRGCILPGYAADLVLFDDTKLKSLANFTNPHKKSEGILKVWVNGVLSYDNSNITGNRAGQFLKNH